MPAARVGHADAKGVIGADQPEGEPAALGHGLQRVHAQVEEDLLQLVRVAAHASLRLRQDPLGQLDPLGPGGAVEQASSTWRSSAGTSTTPRSGEAPAARRRADRR